MGEARGTEAAMHEGGSYRWPKHGSETWEVASSMEKLHVCLLSKNLSETVVLYKSTVKEGYVYKL